MISLLEQQIRDVSKSVSIFMFSLHPSLSLFALSLSLSIISTLCVIHFSLILSQSVFFWHYLSLRPFNPSTRLLSLAVSVLSCLCIFLSVCNIFLPVWLSKTLKKNNRGTHTGQKHKWQATTMKRNPNNHQNTFLKLFFFKCSELHKNIFCNVLTISVCTGRSFSPAARWWESTWPTIIKFLHVWHRTM